MWLAYNNINLFLTLLQPPPATLAPAGVKLESVFPGSACKAQIQEST